MHTASCVGAVGKAGDGQGAVLHSNQAARLQVLFQKPCERVNLSDKVRGLRATVFGLRGCLDPSYVVAVLPLALVLLARSNAVMCSSRLSLGLVSWQRPVLASSCLLTGAR